MRLLLAVLTALLLFRPAGAQTRFTYSKGQRVSPSYEGWTANEDGSLYFGYMNSNWLEEFDVPICPDNAIAPGGPNQGQPTYARTIRGSKRRGDGVQITCDLFSAKRTRPAAVVDRLPGQGRRGDLYP